MCSVSIKRMVNFELMMRNECITIVTWRLKVEIIERIKAVTAGKRRGKHETWDSKIWSPRDSEPTTTILERPSNLLYNYRFMSQKSAVTSLRSGVALLDTVTWQWQRLKLKKKKTPWSESARELYRPGDRRLSAKWLATFADRGCHVISVTDPYGRISEEKISILAVVICKICRSVRCNNHLSSITLFNTSKPSV
jgi:hypothetical protein